MTESAQVAMIGTGYVGLATGAVLAHLGHAVVCCDIDADKIAVLESGQVPIVEAGLSEIIAESRAAGRLRFALGSDPAVRAADVVFLCVPTPQRDDGSADLSFVEAATSEIAPLLKPGAVVVNKSTVPVGTARRVASIIARDDIEVASNPEFLREGTAVYDCLNPDRVVIGARTDAAADVVERLYKPLETKIIRTDPESAELIKYAANGFLAMKLSFVNSVATLCEQIGADIEDVVAGVGSDNRIGSAFLKPGPGWGGSCFPKDAHALANIAESNGFDFEVMKVVIDANLRQFERTADKIAIASNRPPGGRLDGVEVACLGLTFKAGTDDLRESPALRISRHLVDRGATVRGYDPTVDVATPHSALADVELCSSALEAATGAHVVTIMTEWPEFAELDVARLSEVMAGRSIVDGRNILDPATVRSAGLNYTGVGR